MNPVFVFLVLLGAIILWVLLSSLYRLFGSVVIHYYSKTKQAINEDDNMSKEENDVKVLELEGSSK